MLKPLAMLATVLAMTACGPAPSPEAKANLAKNNAIWSTRQTYDMSGVPVSLAIAPDRSYVLLAPVNRSQPLTFAQAEAGIKAVTKCTAVSDGLLMMITKGEKNVAIPFDKMKDMDRLRFDLKC
ncbi:hypothetical protein [Paracoccus sp. (in: a-proteobacteria)]|uniref:hypothetical protein n=1 Tax=Paracoccus sp. TaxID=267 RepID=UPI0035B01F74